MLPLARLIGVSALGLALGTISLPAAAQNAGGFGSSYEVVAFSGQPAPGGGTFGDFRAPTLGADGSVAFVEFDALRRVRGKDRVFAGKRGNLRLVASSDQSAPGVSGNFESFSRTSVGSNGRIAFNGSTFGSEYTDGIWAENAAGGLTYALGSSASSLSAVGPVAFRSGAFIGAKALVQSDGAYGALFFGAPGNAAIVLADGNTVSGRQVQSVYSNDGYLGEDSPGVVVDVNESGTAALNVRLAPLPAPSPTPTDAIVVGSRNAFKTAVTAGQTAPGTGGATFADLGTPSIASNGRLAFTSVLNGVVEGAGKSAAFVGEPGNLSLVVREGDAVAGAPGVTFETISEAVTNETGDVVFQATIRYPNESTREGLWIKRISGPPVLIAISGMNLPTPSGPREVASVDFAGPGTFNDLHQFAFLARFDEETSGIYLADTRPLIPYVRVQFPRVPRDRVTTAKFIEIRGVAEDETGIARVEYTVEKAKKRRIGPSRPIPRRSKGDRRWSFRVPLALGVNRISVVAVDKLGNRSEPVVLAILRYECEK